MFSHKVVELISMRTSRRAYQKRPIEREKADQLSEFLAQHDRGVFSSKMRFHLVAAEQADGDELKKLGTYGFIKNAPGFIVGGVEPGQFDLEDYGFAMERAILKATDLDLGTCWLGGTFQRSSFTRRVSATELEKVPAVAAVGHATPRRGTFDKIVRFGAGSKRRKSSEELFFHGRFGVVLPARSAGEFSTPLETMRLAPSASNKQPWRIVKERDKQQFHFFLQRSPGYTRNLARLGLADLQRIDMGIAMCHFDLAARELGLRGEWVHREPKISLLPDHTYYVATFLGSEIHGT